MGLGQAHLPFAFQVKAKHNVLAGFLKANVLQLLVSYIYLALNNILTTMLAMGEWCAYSSCAERGTEAQTSSDKDQDEDGKGLRVSSPAPNTAQRSTYTLSVPLKWGIPTTACIAVLHWLVSQMFFCASIDVYPLSSGADGGTGSGSGSDAGSGAPSSLYNTFYSPLAMVISVSLGSATLIVLLAVAIFKRYPGSIPLAGCCSASLAAACQPSRSFLGTGNEEVTGEEEEVGVNDLVYKKLKWGVVEGAGDVDIDVDSGIGHATFAVGGVTPLMVGKLYA
ncbi:uncharacterized protein ASPGLDRAFT_34996 [Aspergillus glaucus CBS 516.65]|uniref:Uncharacterized protein n=1 Tax=Aspergillus glaucus CBS 516.65 TaxID=1160497 RepID=A0A1L9VKT3_ASPGL|nr:hypothetical protein ASPGLDRAFT_34996 [Aspergillus glaucus CBS 516.65]OJJ84492.1 hypothetical protein ASPGLDRAFT_34996 [Aspergillus glaucus CBS 516.65]